MRSIKYSSLSISAAPSGIAITGVPRRSTKQRYSSFFARFRHGQKTDVADCGFYRLDFGEFCHAKERSCVFKRAGMDSHAGLQRKGDHAGKRFTQRIERNGDRGRVRRRLGKAAAKRAVQGKRVLAAKRQPIKSGIVPPARPLRTARLMRRAVRFL